MLSLSKAATASGRADRTIYGPPHFATLIFDGELACLNLFGVVVGIAPRATMRFVPDDP